MNNILSNINNQQLADEMPVHNSFYIKQHANKATNCIIFLDLANIDETALKFKTHYYNYYYNYFS